MLESKRDELDVLAAKVMRLYFTQHRPRGYKIINDLRARDEQ